MSASANVFGARLNAAFLSSGHLCVGIDPHGYLLESWGLADDAKGVLDFGMRVVDAVAGRAGIIKPQVAFFERHGPAGFLALESVLQSARDAGLVVIADAKRGDIGSTAAAYGAAWLTPGAALESDAMTISAFQGVGSLDAPMQSARSAGKGLFVLAATSNPESFAAQTAIIGRGPHSGLSVAASIVADVARANQEDPAGPLGAFGVVIGATVELRDYGISDADLAGMPILAPGFGHQGARFSELSAIFGSAAVNVVVSASRSILEAGPLGITDAIERQAEELAGVFPA